MHKWFKIYGARCNFNSKVCSGVCSVNFKANVKVCSVNFKANFKVCSTKFKVCNLKLKALMSPQVDAMGLQPWMGAQSATPLRWWCV